MADNVQLTKGHSFERNALNEIVEERRSEKRMRDESGDEHSDQYDQMSDKRDLKYSQPSDSRSSASVHEVPVQNKSNKFVRRLSDEGNEVFRRAKRKIPVIQRSLAIVLASLLGVQIVIELRNDSEITGTVDETDASMNVTLNNVRKVSPSGEVTETDMLFLQGSTIRYVHIPPEYGIGEHLTHYMKTIERISVKAAHKIKG